MKITLPIVLVVLLINKDSLFNRLRAKADSLNFSKNLTQNTSNKARFGMQYASLCVFVDNPIFGVGLGQDAYHKREYYPRCATDKNHEFTGNFQN